MRIRISIWYYPGNINKKSQKYLYTEAHAQGHIIYISNYQTTKVIAALLHFQNVYSIDPELPNTKKRQQQQQQNIRWNSCKYNFATKYTKNRKLRISKSMKSCNEIFDFCLPIHPVKRAHTLHPLFATI